nr:zinc-binding dehydrogenase [Rhodohalobacter mucosus]
MLVTCVSGKTKAKFSANGALPVKETRRLLHMLLEIIEAGKLRGILCRTYPLEQFAQAYKYVDTGRKKGYVVLNPIL